MIILMKHSFKLFFKSIYLAVGFIIFFTGVNLYLIECMTRVSIHNDVLYYLQESQMMSMLFFAFFVFISYEYLVKSKNNNLLECFSVIDGGKTKLYLSQIAFLTIIALAMTLNVTTYNFIIYLVTNINSKSFVYHIVLNNFMNIFLVSFLGICVGILCTIYLKRFFAYLLMIFITVLISPICEFVPFVFFNGYGINIYPFIRIFDILPPDLDWIAEVQYGLSIETYRWNLLIFWISLLSFFALFKLSSRKIKTLSFLALLVLVVISFSNLYGFFEPSSFIKKDYNPKNTASFDQLYYIENVQKEETAKFGILAYNMKFVVDKQLYGDVRITLNEKEPLENYRFTLYRNYKIEKILSKDNEDLRFSRVGDYLEVFNSTDEKLREIRIIYSGYSPVFYSNSQGVLLPGFFPYYPVEGYKIIYKKTNSSFIPIIRDYNVEFNVHIKSDLEIYSNLQKTNNNFFGEAQAVTLVGGFIEEKVVGDNTLYELTLAKMNTDYLRNINNALEPYRNIFQEDINLNFIDKKVFQTSSTIHVGVLNNGLVGFDDHIFVYGLREDILTLSILHSLVPQEINKMGIKNVLFDYLVHKDKILSISKEELENNKRYELYALFLKKIDELGELYVIRNTYYYLKNENDMR
ncbi:ABC transporter permease, partial [bacterium AH-315-L21]|nr:ABC transporter permease [bacterium AH-315-L21]